jgi:peptidase M23-like protein
MRKPYRYLVSALALGIAALFGTVVMAGVASAAPVFKAPFPCGQSWTYAHFSGEVRQALDFIRNDGTTNGTPVLASAAGTAHRRSQPSGAGNYIVIDHSDGWQTYYFHLSAYSVADGASVAGGQQIGVTGATGNATGPHIHYEQLLNGTGQPIKINGAALAPYPASYGVRSITSDNGCGGKAFNTWGTDVRVHSGPHLSSSVVTTLAGPTRVIVICQVQGDTVTAEGFTNNWWAKLRDQGGYITNIYIDDPAAHLPGVPDC